jgi:hypothetical protein
MEALSSVKNDTKRIILNDFFPGLVACWPWVVVTLLWFRQQKIEMDGEVLKHLEIPFYLILLIGLFGTGHFISKIGLRIEASLEYLFLLDGLSLNGSNLRDPLTTLRISIQQELSIQKDTFYITWYDYLKVSCEKDKEPIILRYYSNFITGYKFELSMLCAILLMCISITYLEYYGYTNVFTNHNLCIFLIICTLIFLYLLYEAIVGLSMANELREEIVKWHSNNRNVIII